MIDFNRIIGFQWDQGNARKNADKHKQSEPRFHALGITKSERRLHVTFTLREDNTRIRVISARDMHRKERSIYE